MSNEVLKRFDFGVSVTKAWHNKETGKNYLKAIASDTGVDAHGERFSDDALNGMVNCIKNNTPTPVILLPTHWDTFEIGKAVEATVIPSPTHDQLKALEVTIELDMEYPQAKALYNEVESGKAQKQLSVGGFLNPENDSSYFWETKTYELEDGNTFTDYTLVLNDLILDHIAVTRKDQAANPRTGFVQAIAKSLGIEKPETFKKEVEQMSKAEKAADSLTRIISKGIKDFFKSTDADVQAINAATEAGEKFKSALAEVKKGDSEESHPFTAELQAIQDLIGQYLNDYSSSNNEYGEGEIVEGDQAKSKDNKNDGDPEDAVDDGADESEEDKNGKKKSVTAQPIDVESLTTEISKSLEEKQNETFKSIAKSLGEAVGETLNTQLAPVIARLDELEKFSGKSKGLDGQESIDAKVKSTEASQEEEGSFAGIIKNAIPSHVIAERKHNGN